MGWLKDLGKGIGDAWQDTWEDSGSFFTETLDPLGWVDNDAEKAVKDADNSYDKWTTAAENVTVDQAILDDQGRTIGTTGGKDYSSLWSQLDDATGRTIDPVTGEIIYDNNIPDLNTWMDSQGYEMHSPMESQAMTDLEAMVEQLTTGPTPMELNQAVAYAESTMGLDPGTYNEVVSGLRVASEQSVDSFEGMSDEERDLRERSNRNDLRGMEEMATRMIDNIGSSTGSVSRSYAAADQAISQINDAQLSQAVTMADDDYMRKSAESDKAMQRYQIAVQNGQMSKSQYLQIVSQNKSMALQGYATQINTMMQENQQYLQMYEADARAIQANIDNIYKAIQMEIGIDEKAMSDIERAYQLEMAPILNNMNIALNDIEMAEGDLSTFSLGQFLLGSTLTIAGAETGQVGLATVGAELMGGSF